MGYTMCLRTSSQHVSTVSFGLRLSGVRFGPMSLNHVIREFRLMEVGVVEGAFLKNTDVFRDMG